MDFHDKFFIAGMLITFGVIGLFCAGFALGRNSMRREFEYLYRRPQPTSKEG